MALGPGTRLGSYEIVALLGAGGMGEVWRARDTRLDRAVALKVLPEAFARDLDRLGRFEREAKTLATLSHPGIAALYGLETHDDRHVLVMELVSGEDLSTLLGRGALPVPEALKVGGQIAEALAEAHAKGIVHRDLKPANVRVVGDGRVKLLDFGLARPLPSALSAPDGFSQSPTLASPTREGAIVGTVAYMSPEQARGLRVDQQTDIWAFGVVLFEMLAGRHPFVGPTLSDTLAALLKEDPDWSALPQETPAAVHRLLRRCLERDPKRRLHAIADALVELQETAAPERRLGPAPPSGRGRRRLLLAALAALGLGALATLWVTRWGRVAGVPRPGRLTRVTAAPGLELDPALSPDGRTLAYAAGAPGAMRLYVQQVAGGRVLPLAEGLPGDQRWPQWSPDGSRILFHAGVREDAANQQSDRGALYAVAALGGTPRRLLDGSEATDPPFCASWAPDGARIAFASGNGMSGRAIFVADVASGTTARRLADAVDAHSLRWSPDGTRIAYVSGNPRFTFGGAHFGNDARSSIVLVAVETGATRRITSGEWLDLSPVWTPDGRTLLFVSNREGARDVYRVGILGSGEPDGAPERITSGLNAHGIDLSADGRTLGYSVYTPRSHIWSVPLPASGTASLSRATALTSGSERVEGLALSADGRFIAYDSDRSGNGDIWKIPTGGGAPEQVTTDASGDYIGDWSPDGQEIALHSFRAGRRQVYVMAADGSAVHQVAESPYHQANPDWSPDGNQLVFDSWLADSGTTQVHVVARRERGAAWEAPRLLTPAGGSDASWSPDGGLIAYVANHALRVVSPSGEHDRVVVDGSRPARHPEPRFAYWSADGRTLYYKAYDDRERSSIWSVAVAGGTPRLLIRFDDPMRPSSRREFATDGARLYFTIAEHESDVWVMELLRR